MNIALGTVRWLLALIIGITASLWVILGTVNITVANRGVTKQWLESGGIYNNALTNVLQVSSDSQAQTSVITPDALRQALAQTFDAAYLRQSTNTVIDSIYDWFEGKTQTITFTIAVQEKSEVFRSHLNGLIAPQLEALPVCASKVTSDTNQLTCLPIGVNAADYAAQLTKPSSDNTFLSAPFTEQTFGQGFSNLGWLPTAYSWLRISFWALPLCIFGLAALYVLASPNKLTGISRVGRQLTINAAITLVTGAFLWMASGAVDLSQAVEGADPEQTKIIGALVNPLVRTVLPDIGRALTFCSAALALVGVLLWLGVFLWRKRPQKTVVMPPTPAPKLPLPTAAPVSPKRKIDF